MFDKPKFLMPKTWSKVDVTTLSLILELTEIIQIKIEVKINRKVNLNVIEKIFEKDKIRQETKNRTKAVLSELLIMIINAIEEYRMIEQFL